MLHSLILACTEPAQVPAAAQPPKSIEVTAALTPENRCDGTSPEIRWSGVPEEASSIALALVRPSEEGPWVHWATWGIPAEWTGLEPNIRPSQGPPLQGINSAGSIGYFAPCPETPTRYAVRVFALDVPVQPAPIATWSEFGATIQAHTVAWGNLLIDVDDVAATND